MGVPQPVGRAQQIHLASITSPFFACQSKCHKVASLGDFGNCRKQVSPDHCRNPILAQNCATPPVQGGYAAIFRTPRSTDVPIAAAKPRPTSRRRRSRAGQPPRSGRMTRKRATQIDRYRIQRLFRQVPPAGRPKRALETVRRPDRLAETMPSPPPQRERLRSRGRSLPSGLFADCRPGGGCIGIRGPIWWKVAMQPASATLQLRIGTDDEHSRDVDLPGPRVEPGCPVVG